jgi:uncharacterized protein (DUF1800 family)
MNELPHPFRPTGSLPSDPLGIYAGRWDARLAAHLLRRAGFGGSPADVAALARGTMRAAVSALVSFPSTANLPDPPLDTALEADMQAPMMPAASDASAAPNAAQVEMRKARRLQERKAIVALQLWWLDRMIATPAPLQEKMTLFWHGHFTTAAIQKGVTPADIVAQNALFRSYALGNVRELTGKVAMDPAMLRYLDNIHNEAAHPNENFARELMELYTLGIGNYSEADVREAARAWTGLRVRRATGEVFLNPRLHDDEPKTFLGRTGNFAGPDIVAVIFAQPAAARFFATKLLTFFVYADPEPELVDAVAGALRAHDFELAPVMTTLLCSNVFYSDRAYRALVKSPVEFVVGSYRLFGVASAEPAALAALRRMTQILFYPPNVKGWPGGSAWLGSSTVLARENFANGLMTASVVDASPWLLAAGSGDARTAAAALVDAIVQGDASPAARAKIEAYLSASEGAMLSAAPGPRDTSAMADGSTMTLASRENIDGRMRGGAYLTMATPAYQLA